MADRPGILDRLLLGNPGVPLAAGQLPPRKVAWLNPLQLLRTGYHVWLISAATGIIDRREMLAALDHRTVAMLDPLPGVFERGKKIDAVLTDETRHKKDGVWLDFLADVGDSWEATYAMASLLVDPQLRGKFPESATLDIPEKFGPADVVVLGGDLVYPMASRDGYRRRFQAPFTDALPERAPKSTGPPLPAMFAIPGNHDWYDGLTNFFRLFCQGGVLGGWQLFQRRSYFAVKLTEGWWLWGIDIALDTRIDSPQQDYFLSILQASGSGWETRERFTRGDRVILCTAKPAWVEISRYSDEAFRNLVYFVEKLVNDQGGSVPVILAGDLHHYSRYANERGDQMIVSGGGGSYVMGTHFLPDRIPTLASPAALRLVTSGLLERKPSTTAKSPQEPSREFIASGFPYPSRADSRTLALGSLWLARRPANWLFCLMSGAVYWFLARGVRPSHLPSNVQLPKRALEGFFQLPEWLWHNLATMNLVVVIGVVCVCAVFAVLANGRASRVLTAIWGTIHGVVHVWLAVGLLWFLAPYSPFIHLHFPSTAFFVLPSLFVLLAGLAGGTFVGIYLAISDRYFDLHHNEAFAVQSLIDYRNFLRIHIRPDGVLEIFPIGLRRVPRRWRRRMDAKDTEPRYEPDDELSPHLIEGPIRIEPNR
jgi:hypothetical protein